MRHGGGAPGGTFPVAPTRVGALSTCRTHVAFALLLARAVRMYPLQLTRRRHVAGGDLGEIDLG
jgi:hypothetical protein